MFGCTVNVADVGAVLVALSRVTMLLAGIVLVLLPVVLATTSTVSVHELKLPGIRLSFSLPTR